MKEEHLDFKEVENEIEELNEVAKEKHIPDFYFNDLKYLQHSHYYYERRLGELDTVLNESDELKAYLDFNENRTLYASDLFIMFTNNFKSKQNLQFDTFSIERDYSVMDKVLNLIGSMGRILSRDIGLDRVSKREKEGYEKWMEAYRYLTFKRYAEYYFGVSENYPTSSNPTPLEYIVNYVKLPDVVSEKVSMDGTVLFLLLASSQAKKRVSESYLNEGVHNTVELTFKDLEYAEKAIRTFVGM